MIPSQQGHGTGCIASAPDADSPAESGTSLPPSATTSSWIQTPMEAAWFHDADDPPCAAELPELAFPAGPSLAFARSLTVLQDCLCARRRTSSLPTHAPALACSVQDSPGPWGRTTSPQHLSCCASLWLSCWPFLPAGPTAASPDYQGCSNGIDPPNVGVRLVAPFLPGGLCVSRSMYPFAPQQGRGTWRDLSPLQRGATQRLFAEQDLLPAGLVSTQSRKQGAWLKS